MLFLERAAQALERIGNAETARSNFEKALEFSPLSEELSQHSERASGLVARFRFLKSKNVPVAAPPDLAKVEERLKSVATLFIEKPSVSTLKSGQRWTALVSALDALSASINKALAAGWKSYFETKLFGGLPPEVLKGRLAATPINKKNLAQYAQLYQQLIFYRDRPPETAQQFEELQAVSRKLEAITFEENVPTEVATFLRATSSEEGGELALLTPSVLEWLMKHDLADKYVVRARMR